MGIDPKIHNTNHILKSMLGSFEAMLSPQSEINELTVVNYHGTQKKFIPHFRKQLEYFLSKYEVLDPAELRSFYSSKLKPGNKPFLLLSFDDGVLNNLYAAEILDELKIKAIFFVIPDFIDTPADKQKEYFIKNIRPAINPNIDSEEEDFKAISWEGLRSLRNKGHSIGSHTTTHTLVAKNSSTENSIREVAESRSRIAQELNLNIDSIDTFCSINNTLESIGEKELKLIKENYRFHFTTIPGRNSPDSDPFYIKRCNIESHWLEGAMKYALGKWDLKRWKSTEKEYLKISGTPKP